MVLTDNETILMKVPAETMFFSLFRFARYTLMLTDKRILLKNVFGMGREYNLQEIESVELYKVSLVLPFGLRFRLRNGEKLELAVFRNEAFADELLRIRPQITRLSS